MSSPCQRASVGEVKHLVRVQEFPEAVEELSALQPAAPLVDEHQQGADLVSQLLVLTQKPKESEQTNGSDGIKLPQNHSTNNNDEKNEESLCMKKTLYK